MLAKLGSLGADVAEGVGVSGQRRGETAADAAKREMRAKKEEASAAQNWQSWRMAHPWRGLSPDRSSEMRRALPTTGDDFPDSPRSLPDRHHEYAQVYSPRQGSHGDIPL